MLAVYPPLEGVGGGLQIVIRHGEFVVDPFVKGFCLLMRTFVF